MAMAIRISDTPAPLTATFEENVSPWNYVPLLFVVIFLVRFGIGSSPVSMGVMLFQGLLFTVVPLGRGGVIEVSPGEVTWKKTFFGFAWQTRQMAFDRIYTIRWMPKHWPWFSRYRVPSYALVKLNGGGHFKFASTITLEEYGVLQRAIEARFPDLYQVTENAFEDNWKELV
jgi:hypothetical protein